MSLGSGLGRATEHDLPPAAILGKVIRECVASTGIDMSLERVRLGGEVLCRAVALPHGILIPRKEEGVAPKAGQVDSRVVVGVGGSGLIGRAKRGRVVCREIPHELCRGTGIRLAKRHEGHGLTPVGEAWEFVLARVVEAGIAVVCWGEVHEVIDGEAVCGKLGAELGALRRADDGDRGRPVDVVPYVGLNLLELIERDVCEGGSLVLLPPEVEAKDLIALLGDRLCLLVSRRALG